MEIQPRRDILELWRATIDFCYGKEGWSWGGQAGRNSVSDAEQLLTILYPATVIQSLAVGSVDQTSDDVLNYLHSLGNGVDIPQRLVEFIGEYMRTYLVDGTPDFSGGTYFTSGDKAATIAPAQQGLDVVDSYSMSLTLCLSTLEFLRVYRQGVRGARMQEQIQELEKLCRQRLSAAMVGLLRSFTVNAFDPDDVPGRSMCVMVNQNEMATDAVVRDLLAELADIRASISQEVELGAGPIAEKLENPGRLFECGWSWGVVAGAPEVTLGSETDSDEQPKIDIGKQPTGVAEPRPYLYFTVAALDGIQDLFSEQTRLRGLLDVDQQRLARALQLRWDVTRQFWTKLATFGDGRRWPIEDLPWITTDGEESDYYSALLTSIVIQNAGPGRLLSADIDRIGRLLGELANRGRITSRPTKNDPAVALHAPGVSLQLIGSEKVADGPQLQWTVPSFSTLLLKRLLLVAELLGNNADRVRTLDLADQIWRHIERRRITGSAAGRGLWDEPAQVFPQVPAASDGLPSWHQTERVMEALVAAAGVTDSPPAGATELIAHAERKLAEAEHLFDQERLRGTNDTGEKMRETFQVVGAKLRRARELLHRRPGTASVLADDVLRELDEIDAARQDTVRMS
jgi:hypothetical protein